MRLDADDLEQHSPLLPADPVNPLITNDNKKFSSKASNLWSVVAVCLIIALIGLAGWLYFSDPITSQLPDIGHGMVDKWNSRPVQEEALPRESEPLPNHQRWASVLEKLRRGEAITIVFLGGSITAEANGYPRAMMEMMKRTFPINATLYANSSTGVPSHRMLNRGTRSTTSSVISLCTNISLLAEEKPDIVSLEFAVNDALALHENNPASFLDPEHNMERFVRNFFEVRSGPALMLVHFSSSTGVTFQSRYQTIANYYGIPSVSWRDEFLKAGRLADGPYDDTSKLYPNDEFHPNYLGHTLMAQLIISQINRMQKSYEDSGRTSLAFSSALSRPQLAVVTPLLDYPEAPLSAAMYPSVLRTLASNSYCVTTLSYIRDDQTMKNLTLATVSSIKGMEWHAPGSPQNVHHPSFHELNSAEIGQFISFRSPIAIKQIAILMLYRTWETSWAHGTAHLSSSTAGPACDTAPTVVHSIWELHTTQITAQVIWSKDWEVRSDCVLDTLTINKTTSGFFHIVGYYTN